MLNPVTPWVTTVRSDLENSPPLWEKALPHSNFVLQNSKDSIWLVVDSPTRGRIAFRIAFGLNQSFENIRIQEKDESVQIKTDTQLGKYLIHLNFIKNKNLMFRYTTSLNLKYELKLPFWPKDIVPLTDKGHVENTTGKIHTYQVGARSGLMYFSITKPKNGSVFYFQNLSAISKYCDHTQTSLSDSVGGNWPEIGFQLPVNPEKALSSGTDFIISDAFVILTDENPENESQTTQSFLDHLAEVYLHLPKPEIIYHDWIKTAKKAFDDLLNNKGSWTQTEGSPFLNAYVGDYETPSEIMVQLAVLLPLREYLQWKDEPHHLADDILERIPRFYDEKIQSIIRWHPARQHELDNSEEQKREMVMDSWYLHHPLLNLSRLALQGVKSAEKIFLNSIDYAIKVAHHFNYEWPVFYRMTTLEVLKAETAPGEGGEKDVPGSYAHIMLMAYKLTGEKRFLREATKALEKIENLGFDIFYQANNTAFTAGALVEIYLETRENKYLELSYSCWAGIFKNVRLWECDYGHAKHFQNFFAVYPLNDAPYTAAYEELEVFTAVHHYLTLTEKIDIPPSLKLLLSEFVKYAVYRLPYYYPPILPHEIITQEVKTGEIQKDLWVPLEDLQDGWEENGQVGQEVYGAGLPFAIVSRQYHIINDNRSILFCDYPIKGMRKGENKLTFNILGVSNFQATLKIIKNSKSPKNFKVEQKLNSKYQEISPSNKLDMIYKVMGNSSIRISW